MLALLKGISEIDFNTTYFFEISWKRFLNFSPTLYVGEHQHGLYAMPSLVDKQTLTITPRRSGPLLLEGPKDYDVSKNDVLMLKIFNVALTWL